MHVSLWGQLPVVDTGCLSSVALHIFLFPKDFYLMYVSVLFECDVSAYLMLSV